MGETLGKQTNSLLLKIILITFDEPFHTTPSSDEEGKSFANSIFIPATSSLSSGCPSFVPQPHSSSRSHHRIITRLLSSIISSALVGTVVVIIYVLMVAEEQQHRRIYWCTLSFSVPFPQPPLNFAPHSIIPTSLPDKDEVVRCWWVSEWGWERRGKASNGDMALIKQISTKLVKPNVPNIHH